MKTLVNYKMCSLIVVLTAVLSLSAFSKDDQPTITKSFDLNQPGTLNASSSGGGVDVKTHDQPKVEIQAFVRKNGRILSPSDKMLDEILDDFEINFSKNGSVITAKVQRKARFNFWNNVGISLVIIVPDEMSCNVSSSGGGLKIDGVKGTHEFTSSGGGVKLDNVSGQTEARSSGGGVKVTNQQGNIRVSSSGGGVSVDDAVGNVVASSSGGGVQLNNIRGNIDASSSGGGVRVSGEVASVKATSSGGSVHADLRKVSGEIYLQSSGGGVDAVIHNGARMGMDLDLRSDRVNIELQNFTGKSEKNQVKGKMNNGGIPVYMHASGGSVNVSFD